jgi:hypothetical protein
MLSARWDTIRETAVYQAHYSLQEGKQIDMHRSFQLYSSTNYSDVISRQYRSADQQKRMEVQWAVEADVIAAYIR